MSEIDNYSIELNLDTNYVECATVSLIREYLARKVSSTFKDTIFYQHLQQV